MAELGPEVGQLLGEYRIERPFDQGGFGTVYLASNINLQGRKVIVKVIPSADEAKRAGLRHEAMQLVELRHPSVVQVISFGEEPGFLYLVEEYLDGETLAALAQHGPLGIFEAVRVAGRIADALEAVHEVGLVHRDLKPANIMLRLSKDRGRFVDWLKLIDFGLAFGTGRTDAVRAGTPEYVAPETVAAEVVGAVTPSTDLYSLGCILYELLTGAVPFEGSVEEMVHAHVHRPAPRVSARLAAVPAELDELVAQLMEKDPAKRPPSAMAVSKALGKIERGLVESATRVRRLSSVLEPAKPAQPTLRLERAAPSTDQALASVRGRRAWPWLLAAVAVAVVVVVGAWAWPRARVDAAVEPVKVAVAALAPAAPSVTEAPAAAPVTEVPAAAPVTEVPAAAPVTEVPAAAPVRSPEPELPLAPLMPVNPQQASGRPPKHVGAPVRPAMVVTSAPMCAFDDRFRDYARRTRAELRSSGAPAATGAAFEKAEDALDQALIERDCRRANDILNELRRLVGVPVD